MGHIPETIASSIRRTVPVLIPALDPEPTLAEIAGEIVNAGLPLLIVDDGSGLASAPVFQQVAALPGTTILRHATNRGKGAALQTGFRHVLDHMPLAAGIVTADADGQHLPTDIFRVARRLAEVPDHLVMGCRRFSASIPLRSRIGNLMTCALYRILYGRKLTDTQTGLRGIPLRLARLMLEANSSGYEFELDMLLVASRRRIAIEEVPIQTVYLDGNASSHFNPLRDSMRIYFVLLRFTGASVLTAILDNAVFWGVLQLTATPLSAQVFGRLAAVMANFQMNRRLVFQTSTSGSRVWSRYLGLVAVSGSASYLGLTALHLHFGIPLLGAKLLAETLLFFVNFLVQRDWVFTAPAEGTSPQEPVATDWTAYYAAAPWTTRLTRRYTTSQLIQALDRAGLQSQQAPALLELGGGRSCFAAPLLKRFAPRIYHVVDQNPLGIELLRRISDPRVVPHQGDARVVRLAEPADAVFSVGLIEHFDPQETAGMVETHFSSVRPGGWVVLSFPSPTWLYRATRRLLEWCGLWNFPDERPLERDEVLAAAEPLGELVWERTLWPLPLTQHMMLFRARPASTTRFAQR